jgi:NAD(P)-dependent dehydrogenase (short-subunit alcohol dehydrogenase family)
MQNETQTVKAAYKGKRRDNILGAKERMFFYGGGDSGLGSASARRLATEGAVVIVADIGADSGTAVDDGLGQGAIFVEMDVTAKESMRFAHIIENPILNGGVIRPDGVLRMAPR